jgi:hypothetical protein
MEGLGRSSKFGFGNSLRFFCLLAFDQETDPNQVPALLNLCLVPTIFLINHRVIYRYTLRLL